MALFGFLFTLYLTYAEFFLMRTVCTWCLASAVFMTLGVRRGHHPHRAVLPRAGLIPARAPAM
jgi:hypothetical protein